MKKLIFLSTLSLVVLFGCYKGDETLDSEITGSHNLENPTQGWVLNLNDGNPTWEVIQPGEQLNSTDAGVVNRGNSAHAHGDFQYGSSATIVFSGTKNNGGLHGSAEFNAVYANGNLHFKMSTANLVLLGADENEAIYCGQITEVIENTLPVPPPPPPPPSGPPPPPPPPPFGLGSYFYFRVMDNGQGENAPLDKYHTLAVSTRAFLSNGGTSLPWYFGSYQDMQNPSDNIKVNN